MEVEAVITAAPDDKAVTSPQLVTDATEVSVEDHVKVSEATDGRTVAIRVVEAPSEIDIAELLNMILLAAQLPLVTESV